jgi:hypothetical protein
MNKNVFNTLILDPANVDPKYKKELKNLVDDFPYSANIRLLYLSALLNDTDIHFEEELKKTAGYISDRRVLRQLIDKPDTKENYIVNETIVKVKQKESESLIISDADEHLHTSPERIEKVININEEEDSLQVKATAEVLPETKDIKPEIVIEDTEIRKSEEGITKEPGKKPLPEEELISTPEEPIQTSTSFIPELENQIISSAVNASLSLEVDKASAEIKLEELQAQTEENNDPKSFLEWISVSAAEVKPEISPKQAERLAFKKRAESLINEFITNQPKIKPKKEFYSPENMAKKSLIDNENIVTETLAKVYADQGNISKAKSIYEQLILRFPEKKSYFATLIRNLGTE